MKLIIASLFASLSLAGFAVAGDDCGGCKKGEKKTDFYACDCGCKDKKEEKKEEEKEEETFFAADEDCGGCKKGEKKTA